jgi:acyl-CoA thioesterase FadM
MFSIPVSVTSLQIDPDYKHAHHTTVLCLLEEARIAFIESAGLPQSKLFAQDLWAVISEIHVEYFREVKEGQYIASCDKISIERSRMIFEQRVLDLSGKEIVQAKVKIMWFSKEKGRAITPPLNVIEAILEQIKLTQTQTKL